MNQNFLSIENDIEAISNNHITMVKSFDYKWIAAIVIGISMFWLQTIVDPLNGAPTMAILVLGFALLILGIIKFFSRRTFYYVNGTEMKFDTFEFDSNHSTQVLECCELADFEGLASIPNDSHSRILLKVLHDDKFDVVYIQNFKFEDYVYKPCNLARKLDCKGILSLLSFIKHRN